MARKDTVNVNVVNQVNALGYKPKKKWVAFWLCLIGGLAGLHYFYVGRISRGLLCFCTLNFCTIGWFIDIFVCLTGNLKDKHGMPVCG